MDPPSAQSPSHNNSHADEDVADATMQCCNDGCQNTSTLKMIIPCDALLKTLGVPDQPILEELIDDDLDMPAQFDRIDAITGRCELPTVPYRTVTVWCNSDPDSDPELPNLCSTCHHLLSMWQCTYQSPGFGQFIFHDAVSDGLQKGCDVCKLVSQEPISSCKGYSQDANMVLFCPAQERIDIKGTPYSIVDGDKVLRIPQYPQWGKIRSWIYSETICRVCPEVKPSETQRQVLKRLGVWLIDVNQRCLKRWADGNTYAALSYVWGRVKQTMLRKETLEEFQQVGAFDSPDACSQTIQDAMVVCSRLEIPFLWVDVLCIQQDLPRDHFLEHISNMNCIYAVAEITIVAADSESANYGIHGVSLSREKPKLVRYFLNSRVIAVGIGLAALGVSSVQSLASETKWATRGWTYQEAILSRKLLFFTKQMCFLLTSHETKREDDVLEVVPPFHIARSSRIDLPGIIMPGTSDFSKDHTVYQLISSYIGRTLTNQYDIIDAFQGILTALRPRWGDFWYGMPLNDLCFALSWKNHNLDVAPTPSFKETRFRRIDSPLGRRIGFPSWSWAGWIYSPNSIIDFSKHSYEWNSEVGLYRMIDQGSLELVHTNQSSSSSAGSELSQRLKFELSEDNKSETIQLLSEVFASLDSLIVFNTVVLRIKIAKDPNEVSGGWGVYIHHSGHPQNAQSNEGREAEGDDGHFYSRSVIHINCGWRQSQGDELEFAIINANSNSSATLNLNTVVLNRNDKICSRAGSAYLRIPVSNEDPEGALLKIVERNAIETVILA